MHTLAAMIGWIIFGFIVGLLGRLLVPGRQPLGFLGTTLLGIVGSFAGGAIAALFTNRELGHPSGWLMSIIGAALVLGAYLAYARRSNRIG